MTFLTWLLDILYPPPPPKPPHPIMPFPPVHDTMPGSPTIPPPPLGLPDIGPLPLWPHDDNATLVKFYGKPGTNLVMFAPPWKMVDAWEHKPVSRFEVNSKCLAAFTAAFNEIWDHVNHDQAQIEHYHLHLYGGCFNNRMVRGSQVKLSVHAFGAAIDINPDGAPMGVNTRPTQENMPDFVVAAFKRQGFTWGGDFTSRKDWMHFQAVREG